MLFYTNTVHDFDLARWLMRDEVGLELQAYTTVAVRPEVARFGDVVAGLVNLKFNQGAIGNIESHAQAAYGYDVERRSSAPMAQSRLAACTRLRQRF